MYRECVDATPEERQAILLRFRKQSPNAPPDAMPTPEEEERLLLEIRERKAAIEGETFKMIIQATRARPSYSGNSKHAQLIVLFLMLPIFAGMFMMFVVWLVARIMGYDLNPIPPSTGPPR